MGVEDLEESGGAVALDGMTPAVPLAAWPVEPVGLERVGRLVAAVVGCWAARCLVVPRVRTGDL